MSESTRTLSRQWIPLMGSSCDVRMGFDAMEQASKLLAGSVGSPRLCVVVYGANASEELIERLRRQVLDAGFEVVFHETQSDVRSLAEADNLFQALAKVHATCDDLCCALGDTDILSLAAHVCSSWCGGMSLVAIPTSEIAFLEGVLVPRGLDIEDGDERVAVKAHARHVLLDYDLVLTPLEGEESRYARTLMVATAMSSSERAFSELWDRADTMMIGDEGLFSKQLMATAKARGQAVSSSAVATRQAVGYGQDVARALRRLVVPRIAYSVLVAEGMRFTARLSVAMGKLSIDDMLAQDELLQALGIGTLTCDVDPKAFVAALKAERFARTNRFMLLLPLSVGRVRISTVDDSLLYEHACAWCQAHMQ